MLQRSKSVIWPRLRGDSGQGGQGKTVRSPIICAVTAGLLCPGLNYAYIFGGPLTKTAMSLGAHKIKVKSKNFFSPFCLFPYLSVDGGRSFIRRGGGEYGRAGRLNRMGNDKFGLHLPG